MMLKLESNPIINTTEKLEQVLEILLKNWRCFDVHGKRLAKCKQTKVEHSTATVGGPLNEKMRALNPILAGKVKKQLLAWESQKIIRRSRSPWSAPIVLVPKTDGSIRLCVDYRNLNKITIKDSCPLPNIESSLANLVDNTFFSKLDCKDAYFSIPMEKSSIEKTPFGLWEYLRMLFGLSNSSGEFARVIYNALSHLSDDICVVFQDDSMVIGKNFQQHLQNLDKVLPAYNENGLILQIMKCKILQTHINFLGYRISKEGIGPVSEYVEIVKQIPFLKTTKEIKSLLGKFNFYQRHIHKYSEITKPLSDLIKGRPNNVIKCVDIK